MKVSKYMYNRKVELRNLTNIKTAMTMQCLFKVPTIALGSTEVEVLRIDDASAL